MRRDDVVATSLRRHFGTICPLGMTHERKKLKQNTILVFLIWFSSSSLLLCIVNVFTLTLTSTYGLFHAVKMKPFSNLTNKITEIKIIREGCNCTSQLIAKLRQRETERERERERENWLARNSSVSQMIQLKLYTTSSYVDHVIYTVVCNCVPNIRILSQAVLQIFCSQGWFLYEMTKSKKGHNLWTRTAEEEK